MGDIESASEAGTSKRSERGDFRIRFRSNDSIIFNLEYKLVEDSVVLNMMTKLCIKDNCKQSAEQLHVCSSGCEKDLPTFDIPYSAEDFQIAVDIMRLCLRNDLAEYVDPQDLLIAVEVADYLDIPSLRNYTVERIKMDLKDKKPSAVREAYEVRDTFSLDETKQMKAEGTWVHNYRTTPNPLETETQDFP